MNVISCCKDTDDDGSPYYSMINSSLLLYLQCRFCGKHGKRETKVKSVPPEVTNTAELVISKLITRFVYYLRSKHQGVCC